MKTFRTAMLLGCLGVCGCHEATAPATRTVTISLCGPLAWAAFRNDGGEWQHFASASGTYDLAVTERLTIASVFLEGDRTSLGIEFLTADQLKARYSCAAPLPGSRTIHGTFAGLTGDDAGFISLGPRSAQGAVLDLGFTITGLPEGPLDLVATRYQFRTGAVDVPDVIIRRALDPPSGSAVPVLNFDSTEAFAPEVHTATFAGLPADRTFLGVQTNFHTASGTLNALGFVNVASTTAPIHFVPETEMAAGDLHEIVCELRYGPILNVVSYARLGGDRTISFGPLPLEPTFNVSDDASPPRIASVFLSSQPEYGEAVGIGVFHVDSVLANARLLFLFTTREYVGSTPSAWTFDVPDLTAVEGFDPSWLLDATSFNWYVNESGRPVGFHRTDAHDGDTFYSGFLRDPNASAAPVIPGHGM
jgi:hypothetical protein